MSKRYGESMADWERDQDERDWKRRCSIAAEKENRKEILALIEEGVENDYEQSVIQMLEEL